VLNLLKKQNHEATFWPYPQHQVSDLIEVTHVLLRYFFKEVPPQSNCQQDNVIFRSLVYFCHNKLQQLSQKQTYRTEVQKSATHPIKKLVNQLHQ